MPKSRTYYGQALWKYPRVEFLEHLYTTGVAASQIILDSVRPFLDSDKHPGI